MLEKQKYIPSPQEFLEKIPMTPALKRVKEKRDAEIRAVISGKSEKLLVIVGPCSAHAHAPTLNYITRLGKLQERLSEKLVIVPRIYTNKPRTRGVGYQGMFLQPDFDGEADIVRGIESVRKLHISVMEETGLTGADEMLYPENTPYVDDLVSYFAVGARSVENPLHRQSASGLDVPVGMKNPTSGNLNSLMDSVFAAQNAQVFKYGEYQVRSAGNPYAHAVLRGGMDGNGAFQPNYGREAVAKISELYADGGFCNPAVIVDCNHSNSGKQHLKQLSIAREVTALRGADKDYRKIVKGLMIESFLEEGSDPMGTVFGKSITDPCIGWADTERLLQELAESV